MSNCIHATAPIFSSDSLSESSALKFQRFRLLFFKNPPTFSCKIAWQAADNVRLWTIIERFWYLELSHVDEQMADRYSIFGPTPRPPSCMLRFVMLSIEFKVTSFTEWSRQLKINPLYAIISGFSPGDAPGTGTFYDFYSRLWLSDSKTFRHMSVSQRQRWRNHLRKVKRLCL